MTTKKCWYTATNPPERGVTQVFTWALQNANSKNGVILAGVTNDVLARALMEVVHEKMAKDIVNEKIKRIDGIGVSIATERREVHRGQNRVLVALYPSKSYLDRIDGISDISEMAVVAWNPKEIEEWKITRSATELGGAPATRTEPIIKNKTVVNAMRSLSSAVNKSTGLLHPADKPRAIETFHVLLENGERFDPKEIKMFLVAEEGWEPKYAIMVEEVAKGVLEGKRYRRQKGCWVPNIIDIWRSKGESGQASPQ